MKTIEELIDARPMLNLGECRHVAEQVKLLRAYWVNRGAFYTLGAATYQDDPLAYPTLAHVFNPILRNNFRYLFLRLIRTLAVESPVFYPFTALPGFHVIDKRANGVVGSIHIDEPYERVDWGCEVRDPFSFTMAVALPACGGGMNIWPNCTDEDISAYEVDHAIPEPDYFPYKLGVLYVHSGLVPHQMANPGVLGRDDLRITFQGHGVVLESGVTALYF